jgi:phenylpropionate dioxygenase-like ring-hydroxylating dioxygenase large terminal subunit
MNTVPGMEAGLSPGAVEIPLEAYVSPEYARAERRLLWDRAWQVACREEEIPKVGDYCTYDIQENSVILVRSGPDEISAFNNTCRHRGRRLADGCGHTDRFVCKYHAWQYGLDGANSFIPNREDWGGALDDKTLGLGRVKTGRWGGFVFVNFDPDSEPFEAYVGAIPHWLDPFEMQAMRYKWRRWTRLACNWKVALDAFIETYHAAIIHPQNRKFGNGRSATREEGLHSCLSTVGRDGAGLGSSVDATQSRDHRQTALATVSMIRDTIGALTTDTFVRAAEALPDLLPATASAAEVSAKLMETAREMDSARGVVWPTIEPEHIKGAGFAWHVFPNTIIEPAVSYGLVMRFRPDGYDPDSCIFEAHALERFPEGEVPVAENVYEPELTVEKWRLLWVQDFENLPDVQRGMKCSGPQAVRPNPVLERAVVNFHRNLARYIGAGAPQPLRPPVAD